MERKTKSRLLIGGLIVFSALIAVYTYWVFLSSENRAQDWQAFLLNISTELIGALIVYFFFNLFFFLDDWDLSERVQNLLNRLERERPTADKFFHKMPDVGPFIQEAESIDLCGVSLTSTINRHFTLLRDGLAEGKRVRLLIIDPRTTAVEMANARSEAQDIEYYKKRLDASLSDIRYLWDKWEGFTKDGTVGAFQVRLMFYAPSFGLVVSRRARSKSQMIVEVYPHHGGYGSPPLFTLNESDDSRWYQYFSDQFEDMWSKAVEWSPDLLQEANKDARTIYSQAKAQDFLFESNPDQTVYFRNASEICLLGINLSKTLTFHMHSLQKTLEKSNTKIRVIITSKDFYDTNQERSKALLQSLISDSTNHGIIEVREFTGAIPFSIIATDPGSINGHMQVMIYLPIWKNKNNVKFELFHDRDKYWMSFFLNQFEGMWQASQPISFRAAQAQDNDES